MKTFGITRKTAQKSAVVIVGRPVVPGARVGTRLP